MMGGGAFYTMFKDSDPLSPFYDATRKVYQSRFGNDLAGTLINETKQAYQNILPKVPYIGGKDNIFSEWLNYGAYYLGMYQVLSAHGHQLDDIGRLIFKKIIISEDYKYDLCRSFSMAYRFRSRLP